ncbi:HalOD1 output domain-containing protein [Saliphagus sp. GCM10025308]
MAIDSPTSKAELAQALNTPYKAHTGTVQKLLQEATRKSITPKISESSPTLERGTMTATESVQRRYDWSDVDPSMAVINALASLEDARPVNLSDEVDGTLCDFVDPEALDALVTDKSTISISFMITEYEVHIDGDKLQVYYE